MQANKWFKVLATGTQIKTHTHTQSHSHTDKQMKRPHLKYTEPHALPKASQQKSNSILASNQTVCAHTWKGGLDFSYNNERLRSKQNKNAQESYVGTFFHKVLKKLE